MGCNMKYLKSRILLEGVHKFEVNLLTDCAKNKQLHARTNGDQTKVINNKKRYRKILIIIDKSRDMRQARLVCEKPRPPSKHVSNSHSRQ